MMVIINTEKSASADYCLLCESTQKILFDSLAGGRGQGGAHE